MVPLVESLMDRRANSSFTRRASMVYTPTPAQLKKVSDSRSRKTTPGKKQRDNGNKLQHGNQGGSVDDCSENVQKDRFELTLLREQVDSLQRKLLEKEEALKTAEDSAKQMNMAYVSINELRHQVAEKDALIKSANSELYNAKIKLADKQAALEKLEWETKMSNRKAEELQDEFVSMDLEITALMQIFEELSKNSTAASSDDKITSLHYFEHISPIDSVDEMDLMQMEEARSHYLAALAAAKENPSDESLAIAAEARQRLQAFAF
ncbi:uncharacterized protein A4U43_C05F22090 [Asparagus officinalis]|uniref:Uncharacterized protein n=1 Tax=Asparagus officinalis TaxID=4686 RepID=A0A5P1ETJ5_ASPOF|nr:uncharacterized protein LOC109840217 isoform X2 [Asparagus officinalis]ONK69365.1 uncharacterized protein A4U43_C05F22090 [Asparagus officinalis]